MVEPEQSLNINTLCNVYVVEELIQIPIESNAEIIANSQSVLNSVHASAK